MNITNDMHTEFGDDSIKVYDSNGNMIYSNVSNDGEIYEEWFEYNSDGSMIHAKNSDGFNKWY